VTRMFRLAYAAFVLTFYFSLLVLLLLILV
jgi:hypothetical protein